MRYTLFAVALCLFFASFVSAQNDEINIIPKPRSVQTKPGVFRFSRKTLIGAHDDQGRKSAAILNGLLKRLYGFELKVTKGTAAKNMIDFPAHFIVDGADSEGGYLLNVSPEAVRIVGDPEECFYGIQSFLQLLPPAISKEAIITGVDIIDQPRFAYRGMHLDVSRHFFSVDFVKRYIDLMSQYKFNTFHWHLTDDQGWRIEIKKYPKLTEVGSSRPESVKERNLNPYIGDGVPVAGFYTQEQIKDVVAYAKARYITVIPEIELPGHSSAALAAYPELSCKPDQKYKVQTTWGIFKEVYCPTETTFKFLEDVLDETILLFPDSPYIHIGGDEVLKDMWKDSPEVKELMARENLKDVGEVQSYFVRRMEKFINSKGKKIIGWDEILEGGLAPNATVMSWRGMKGGIEAARAHHDVIMTPTDYVYFDYGQGDPATEPLNIGSYVPLEKVYGFDPVPKELSADEAKYILGGQANLWTEYIPNEKQAEYMAFPRMLALSEALWTAPENKNFEDFRRRLAANLPHLDAQGVNYRIPEPAGLMNFASDQGDGNLLVDLEGAALGTGAFFTAPVRGTKVYYTLDGSTPDERSKLYTEPIWISLPDKGRKELKAVVVLPTGRKSQVYTATFIRRSYLPAAAEIKDKRPGVTFAFSAPPANGGDLPLLISGETRGIGFQPFSRIVDLKQPFGVTYDGFINVPVDAIYEFQIDSKWGAALTVDDLPLIKSEGTADRQVRSEIAPLRAGLHKLNIRYDHHGGDPYFRVRWAIKGQNWRNLGGGELVH